MRSSQKKKWTFQRIGLLITGAALVGLWCFQGATAIQYLGNRFQSKVLANRDLNGFERSVDASYGSEIAASISFLRASIPEQATVLIPSGQGTSAPFNNLYLMQYMLFPRQVVSCQSDCRQQLDKPETYLITQGGLPSGLLIPESYLFTPYDDALGLYAPSK